MRVLLALLISLPLLAQEAAKPAEQAKPEEKKDQAAAAAPAAADAKSPVPAGEPAVTGTVDFGYRWLGNAGNFDVYRSVVNLGEGPKLLGLDFTIQDPKKRLFDRLEARAANWGGDPYNTAHISARKMGLYDFNFDYRNIQYFNFLPSFADPLIGTGLFLNERSMANRIRTSEFVLDLRPGHRVIPYLAYGRSSDTGGGIATFVNGASDEFPVSNILHSHTDNFRGGVRFEMRRHHITLEQGGTTFRQDEQLFSSTQNFGNRTTPFFGQTLVLNNLQEAYGIRGNSKYTKVLATANPVSWADLYGQFLYSQPETNTNYTLYDAGRFAQNNPLLVYSGEIGLLTGLSKQPHTSGNAGVEVRPFRHLRIIESWMTDRLHDAAYGQLLQQLSVPGSSTLTPQTSLAQAGTLVMNYNQQQVDGLLDLGPHVVLRVGHRYVWGDAIAPPSALTLAGDSGQLRRQVALAGFTFRAAQKLTANYDFEGASSDRTYFRTSLHDYQQHRARVRYQAATTLAFGANFSYLNNDNPTPGIKYNFLSGNNTLSAFWTPNGGKRISVTAEYTRSSFRSDISYLDPGTLTPVRSLYRDNAHVADMAADIALPGYAGLTPKLSFGGAMFLSSGSRPTNYYQPLFKLFLPLQKHVAWVTEWRYYGYGEIFYAYEGFRAHLFTTGMRLTR